MHQHLSPNLADIFVAIQALSPGERRQLLRRLSASGLLDLNELLTDQHRLDISPALGAAVARWREPEVAPDSAAPVPDIDDGRLFLRKYFEKSFGVFRHRL